MVGICLSGFIEFETNTTLRRIKPSCLMPDLVQLVHGNIFNTVTITNYRNILLAIFKYTTAALQKLKSQVAERYFSPMSSATVGSMASAQILYPFSLGWSRSGIMSLDSVPSASRK